MARVRCASELDCMCCPHRYNRSHTWRELFPKITFVSSLKPHSSNKAFLDWPAIVLKPMTVWIQDFQNQNTVQTLAVISTLHKRTKALQTCNYLHFSSIDMHIKIIEHEVSYRTENLLNVCIYKKLNPIKTNLR